MKALKRVGLLTAIVSAAACGSSTDPGGGGGGGGGTAEWTVMVYMAADNSLAVQGILGHRRMDRHGLHGGGQQSGRAGHSRSR
jgi:hypothetical protein